MKSVCKFSVIAISAVCASSLLSSVYANNEQPNGQVYAAAINGCTLVKQISLNESEAQAYYEVKALEEKISSIQEPLRGVEKTLEDYSADMEQIADLAIQETEQTLYIDKEMLKQQEGIADKIQALMALHQADFDAIGEFGKMIGDKADAFSDTIEEAFEGLEHHHVTVFSEGESPLPEQCSDNSMM